MKHANLSIFVPHLGCPHQCSFCNQKEISGVLRPLSGEEVTALCREQLDRISRFSQAQIAFFGGSFTAIPQDNLLELLQAAQPFIGAGRFSGIRISTRPDCVEDPILELLKQYQVTDIELGAQSMSDGVLQKNSRGHTADDVRRASERIQRWGFRLGLQMMTGLDGSDPKTDRQTARELAELHPDVVRIYPTVVLKGTCLAQRWRAGSYQPQTLPEAVKLGAELLAFFEEDCRIPVIRMGLHDQQSLREGYLAGPWHPAFRELCEGELWRKRLLQALAGKPAGRYKVSLPAKEVSKVCGHGGQVLDGLGKLGYNIRIQQDTELTGHHFQIEEV